MTRKEALELWSEDGRVDPRNDPTFILSWDEYNFTEAVDLSWGDLEEYIRDRDEGMASEVTVWDVVNIHMPPARHADEGGDEVLGDALDTIYIRHDPEEPECRDGTHDHDWTKETVMGHGGGVKRSRTCRKCELVWEVDTWARGPDGIEGETEIAYREALYPHDHYDRF